MTVAVLGSIAACSLWPSLDHKLRRDFEMMASGRDAKETAAVGTAVGTVVGIAVGGVVAVVCTIAVGGTARA